MVIYGEPTIVNFSKKGVESYLNVYKPVQRMRERPVDHYFEIMRVVFKKLKNFAEHDEIWVHIQFSYCYKELGECVQKFHTLNSNPLVEEVYLAVTGGYLIS